MISFEIEEVEIDGVEENPKVIKKIIDGKIWSQPLKENQGFHAEYLRYTAWVEAGNNPEDFWTRDLDNPDGFDQTEDSEPKEGE